MSTLSITVNPRRITSCSTSRTYPGRTGPMNSSRNSKTFAPGLNPAILRISFTISNDSVRTMATPLATCSSKVGWVRGRLVSASPLCTRCAASRVLSCMSEVHASDRPTADAVVPRERMADSNPDMSNLGMFPICGDWELIRPVTVPPTGHFSMSNVTVSVCSTLGISTLRRMLPRLISTGLVDTPLLLAIRAIFASRINCSAVAASVLRCSSQRQFPMGAQVTSLRVVSL